MRDRDSGRGAETLRSLRVINIEQKCGNFERSEVAAGAYGLRCDVFDGFAGVEADNLVLTLVQALDKTFNGNLIQVPHWVGLLIVELRRSVKHELAQ